MSLNVLETFFFVFKQRNRTRFLQEVFFGINNCADRAVAVVCYSICTGLCKELLLMFAFRLTTLNTYFL